MPNLVCKLPATSVGEDESGIPTEPSAKLGVKSSAKTLGPKLENVTVT